MNAKELLDKVNNGEILPADIPDFTWEYGLEGGENPITGKVQYATVLFLTLKDGSETVGTWEGLRYRDGWKRLLTVDALTEINAYGELSVEYEGWNVVVRGDGTEVRIDIDDLADKVKGRVKGWTQAVNEQLEILLRSEILLKEMNND